MQVRTKPEGVAKELHVCHVNSLRMLALASRYVVENFCACANSRSVFYLVHCTEYVQASSLHRRVYINL